MPEQVVAFAELVRAQGGARGWVSAGGNSSYLSLPAGAPLLYRNSLGRIARALNLGNFAREHRVGYGPEWRIELARPGG